MLCYSVLYYTVYFNMYVCRWCWGRGGARSASSAWARRARGEVCCEYRLSTATAPANLSYLSTHT